MLIVGNWKGYVHTRETAKKLYATAKRLVATTKVKIVLAPPAPYLGLLAPGNRSRVGFAGQDVSATTVSAATGEISADMLRDIGAKYVILGHSERRAMGETDALILEKARRALANGLTPILCIGETTRDEDANYLSTLRSQISVMFDGLSPKERMQMIIAYEPIWAIGKTSAEAIASSDLGEMALYIRKVLAQYLPGKTSAKVKVLYGGSVDPTNIRGIAGGSGIDGFLVGRASSDPAALTALVKAVS